MLARRSVLLVHAAYSGQQVWGQRPPLLLKVAFPAQQAAAGLWPRQAAAVLRQVGALAGGVRSQRAVRQQVQPAVY